MNIKITLSEKLSNKDTSSWAGFRIVNYKQLEFDWNLIPLRFDQNIEPSTCTLLWADPHTWYLPKMQSEENDSTHETQTASYSNSSGNSVDALWDYFYRIDHYKGKDELTTGILTRGKSQKNEFRPFLWF